MEINIEDHIKLSHMLANRYKNSAERLNVDYDDLQQTALIGIWKAAEKFNPSKGAKFSTFASSVAINDMKMLMRSATAGKYSICNPVGDTDFIDLIPNKKYDEDFNEIELKETIQQIIIKRKFKGLKKRIVDCLLNNNMLNRHELAIEIGCSTSFLRVTLKELGVRLRREMAI